MSDTTRLEAMLEAVVTRLDAIDKKLDGMSTQRKKTFEWMGTLSEQVSSLDAFREEVRASLEPLFCKLESIDESMRILRHATSDVSRKVEEIEVRRGKVA